MQKISSRITDWLLRARDGDRIKIDAGVDGQDFVVQNVLRKRFVEVWTSSAEGQLIVERVSPERRRALESSQPSEIEK